MQDLASNSDLLPAVPRRKPNGAEVILHPGHLRREAARCFRLAQGSVGITLAEELESIGLALAREADALEGKIAAKHPAGVIRALTDLAVAR